MHGIYIPGHPGVLNYQLYDYFVKYKNQVCYIIEKQVLSVIYTLMRV